MKPSPIVRLACAGFALLVFASADVARAQLIVADPIHLSPDGALNRRVQLQPVTLGLQRTYEPGLVKDWSRIAAALLGWSGSGRSLSAYSADGATMVVAGFRAPEPGCVEFLVSDVISPSGNCSPTAAAETSVGVMRNCFNEASTGNPLLVFTQEVRVNGQTQHWAFVTIRAPEDFSRGPADVLLSERPVCLEATYFRIDDCTTRLHPAQEFWRGRIVRPPLVLVHGIWSDRGMWRFQAWTGDPFRASEKADYSKTAGASFATNSRVVPETIQRYLHQRRSGGAIAVTQVDILAHSMGGLLSRIYVAGGGCRRRDNWYLGDVNRLVTLNTPHRGSEWADFLLLLPFLVPRVPPQIVIQALKKAGDMVGKPYGGAVEDLATYSAPITGLREAPVPAHAMVGLGGRPATLTLSPEAEEFLKDQWWYVGKVKYFTDAIADDFAHFMNGAAVFFGQEHDTIVSEESQRGGLDGGNVTALASGPDGGFWEMTHTTFGDVPALCSPPHANCLVGVADSPTMLQRFRDLLNSPIVVGGRFANAWPAAPPRLVTQPSSGPSGHASRAVIPVPQPVKGLEIILPSAGAAFSGGSAVTIAVRAINGFTANWVLLGIPGDLEVATFESSSNTWRATVRTDGKTIGPVRISAFGTTSSDRILTADPVTIQSTLPSFVSVTTLAIEPDPVELSAFKPSETLDVVAHCSDSVDRWVLASATGLSFASTNSAIATVDASGKVRSVALGSTSVTAFYASRSDAVPVNVTGLQGDHDDDGDIDLADFGAFADCFSGPKNVVGFQDPGVSCLIAFDYDADGDVDFDDFDRFLDVYTGPVGQDCNANGTDDMLDILNGVATDCDHNGVPDTCGATDCNQNGVADSCDVTPQNFGFDDVLTYVANFQADVVAVGDIDGDGLRDVVVSARNSNGVQPLLNTGGGVLVPGVGTAGFSDDGTSNAIATGDLDGDGKIDAAVANTGNSVTFYRQCGFNGIFQTVSRVILGTSASGVVPNALVLEDFDRDGDLDVAVLKGSPTGGKVEFLRNSGGTFTRLTNSNNAAAGASSIAAADVDSDGKIDLAVANSAANSVLVLRNTSTTSITFANANVPNTYAQAGWFASPVAIAAGDATGDGKPDFLVCNRANGDASLMVNSGTGFFTVTTGYTVGITPTAARSGDLDGDGSIDFAIANDTMTAISALQSAPEACRMTVSAFAAAEGFAVEAGGAVDVALADLDGNGSLDLVSANGPSRTVSVLLNHTVLPTSRDRDGNGRPDECDDCNANGKLDTCDIASGLLTDCNGNGIADSCPSELAAFDCNHNGLHDSCEIAGGTTPDCNQNGIPDSCDIAAGTSADCNANGIPDSCDIAAGTFPDCNLNGILDACEPDCNGNGVPDDCDVGAPFLATSPQLSPIGWDLGAEFWQSHLFPATPAASSNVTLRFFAKGDFSASNEQVSVYVNNVYVGNVFGSANDCPATPDQDTITMTRDAFNMRRGSTGNITILMRPSTAVWTGACLPGANSFIQVQLDYRAGTSADVNGNGIPDECE